MYNGYIKPFIHDFCIIFSLKVHIYALLLNKYNYFKKQLKSKNLLKIIDKFKFKDPIEYYTYANNRIKKCQN